MENTKDLQFASPQEHIGIIGAMEVEIVRLREAMDIRRTETITGMTFYTGTLEGLPVTLVRCGVGKVNAGICAQTLIRHFGVTRVINTGVAGSLRPEINIGDIVVSTDAIQHDFNIVPLDYLPGEIPGAGTVAFRADAALRRLAEEAVRAAAPDIGVFPGRVCTGDQFINSQAQKQAIVDTVGGSCCEMEGGAIAQVCALNGVPFVILRAISDKADDSSHIAYEIFETFAAHHCASIVRHMIGMMG